jgi:hypothetical protein
MKNEKWKNIYLVLYSTKMIRCVCQKSQTNNREQCPHRAKYSAHNTNKPLIYCGIHKTGTCRQFVKAVQIAPVAPVVPVAPVAQPIGIDPPTWDLEKESPVPPQYQQFDYIYAGGSSPFEIMRLFILPPDFKLLVGIYSPKGKEPEPEKPMTIAQVRRLIPGTYYVPPMVDWRNVPIITQDNLNDVLHFQIMNMAEHGHNNLDPQIRRNGKIIKQLNWNKLNQLYKNKQLSIENIYSS